MTNSKENLDKEQCEQLRLELKQTSMEIARLNSRIFKVRQYLTQLESECSKLNNKYKEVDYKLALNDDRFQKVAPKKTTKLKSVTTEYTKTTTAKLVDQLDSDQIKKLAESLGISIERK